MDIVLESLNEDWQSFLRLAPRLVYALLLLLLFFVLGKYSGRAMHQLLRRHLRTRANALFFEYVSRIGITSVGVLLALGVLGFHGVAASLLATGGIAAIVFGFAFREVGENFLAGFFLTLSRPFEIGDLIKTGDLLGEVKSIELRHVHLRTFDGCDVYIPSAQLFREPIVNYTQDGLRRPSFTVGIAYHENPERVLAVLEGALGTVPDALPDPKPFATIREFGSQYIVYEVFFWIDVEKAQKTFIENINAARIACWRSLSDANLTFSTDVSSALDIKTLPPVAVHVGTT